MSQTAATAFQGIDQPDTYAGTVLETRQERRDRMTRQAGTWTWTEPHRDETGHRIGHTVVERHSTDETVRRIEARRQAVRAAAVREWHESACAIADATWHSIDGSAHWTAGGRFEFTRDADGFPTDVAYDRDGLADVASLYEPATR